MAAEFSGGKPNGTELDDLLGAFGMEGDDANEFLEAYADRFGVDMSGFRWEFHYVADEPPFRRRVLPVDRDGKVIPFLPVTLRQLTRAAEAGQWQFDYPEHRIRISRVAEYALALVLVFLLLTLFLLWRG